MARRCQERRLPAGTRRTCLARDDRDAGLQIRLDLLALADRNGTAGISLDEAAASAPSCTISARTPGAGALDFGASTTRMAMGADLNDVVYPVYVDAAGRRIPGRAASPSRESPATRSSCRPFRLRHRARTDRGTLPRLLGTGVGHARRPPGA